MTEPLIKEHRGVQIRCAYNIAKNEHIAYFELPERRPQLSDPIRTTLRLPAGTHHRGDRSSAGAIAKAKAVIDDYLD